MAIKPLIGRWGQGFIRQQQRLLLLKPSFSPDNISWIQRLESDAGITLVSGKVDVWADQSGNGRDVTAVSATNRPDYGLTQFNGIDVLTVNSTNLGRLSGAYGVTLSQPNTMFVVAKFDSNNARFLDNEYGAGLVASFRAGSSQVILSNGDDLDVASAYPIAIYTLISNGATSVIRENSVETTGNAGTNNRVGITIGSARNGAAQFTGTAAAFFTYQGVADATLIANMEAWLANKYGVVI